MVNLVREYADADPSKRVDLIYRYFSIFMRTVDSRTAGLMYIIENEKISNRIAAVGELGVKVTKSMKSDPTANKAISDVVIRDAIISCDFSGGVLDGTDREEEFKNKPSS